MDNISIFISHPKIVEYFKNNEKNITIEQILLDFIDKQKTGSLDTSFTINKYVLEDIMKENYQNAVCTDTIVGLLKENTSKILELLEKNKSTSLEQYLKTVKCSSSFNLAPLKNQYKCELCNYFITTNKRALSAHQRGCKKYVGSL
jgi:hypothetical protein